MTDWSRKRIEAAVLADLHGNTDAVDEFRERMMQPLMLPSTLAFDRTRPVWEIVARHLMGPADSLTNRRPDWREHFQTS